MKEIVFQALLQIYIYETSICMGILKAEIYHVKIYLTPMFPNPEEKWKETVLPFYLAVLSSLVSTSC